MVSTMNISNDVVLWAGSEASYHAYVQAVEMVSGKSAAELAAIFGDPNEDEDEGSRLLQVQDGVGVVSIRGPLTPSDAWYNAFAGVTGYPEIRLALMEAVNNPEVKEILLDVDSPGGSTRGLSELASLISSINANVKPITAVTDGNMASAAYWLGSAAGKVYASQLAVVGSIGVVAIHKEISKALEQSGVKATVIRSGKYKMLGNSVEPLSEDALREIQRQVDISEGVFVRAVAAARGRTEDYTREHMGQGREFMGEEAAHLGLTDGMKTFDSAMSELVKQNIDPSLKQRHNTVSGGPTRLGATSSTPTEDDVMAHKLKKTALTEEMIAAIASGAQLPEATIADTEPEVTGQEVVEGIEAGTEAAVEGNIEAKTEGESEGEVEGGNESEFVAGTVEAADSTLVSHFKAQLKETQDELLTVRLNLMRSEESLQNLQSLVEPLKTVVASSVNNMRVAMNMSRLDFESASADSVLRDHAELSKQFSAMYPAGGVAAASTATQAVKETAPRTTVAARRVAAVRNRK